jgi:SAM-dependent methyltransferase
MPGLMTRMLESLDVRDGHRVLEIGTGTGYNVGLLAHRLGDTNVFSVDIEPDLVDVAGSGWPGSATTPSWLPPTVPIAYPTTPRSTGSSPPAQYPPCRGRG